MKASVQTKKACAAQQKAAIEHTKVKEEQLKSCAVVSNSSRKNSGKAAGSSCKNAEIDPEKLSKSKKISKGGKQKKTSKKTRTSS